MKMKIENENNGIQSVVMQKMSKKKEIKVK